MNWIRSHKEMNRLVVAALMVASVLTFVEHTCHMDLMRLFASMCCCEDGESETMSHHREPNGEGQMEHGMAMEHDAEDHNSGHHDAEVPEPCSHNDRDSLDDENFSDACCAPIAQTDVSPVLVRLIDTVMNPAFIVQHSQLFRLEKPPPNPPLLLSLPSIRISWPPGYIAFGAFLN